MTTPSLSLVATHDVTNVVPPLADFNLYAGDAALREAVAREGAGAAQAWLHARGAELGSAAMLVLADQANRFPPQPRLFDANGNRRDVVEFHPAYHALMEYLQQHGAAAGPWATPGAGAHVRRAAFYVMYAQLEDGTLCPTTMTYASVPALKRDTALAAQWLPRIYACEYDPRFIPAAAKNGVTLGMGMTEKQGGSDVRANTTRAGTRLADATIASLATSGFSPRRCAMRSWSSRRQKAACPASCCPASRLTARSTPSASSA